nr:hypothetical protein [uncultured Mucilaginibacter sp.]
MKSIKTINLAVWVVTVLLSSCRVDPQKIQLTKFNASYEELSGKHDRIKFMFSNQDRIKYVEFKLEDFNAASITAFPDTYKLFQDGDIAEIVAYSSSCIFFVLKIHKGIYDDEFECLKKYNASKCILFKDGCVKTEDEQTLEDDWKYERIHLHICD